MKVQSIQQNKNNVKDTQFKGAADLALRYFATNQAIGANAVDLAFMVMPRSTNDTIKRGPAAGLETFRREIMGTINDSCIGLFGAIAGSLICFGINKKFELNANKIFTSPDTLLILADNKSRQMKQNKTQLDYLKETLSNVKAYNPTASNADKDGYVKIGKSTIDSVSKIIDESLNDSKFNYVEWTKDKSLNSRAVLINKILESTGSETNLVLQSADKKISSNTNLKSLLNDIMLVSHSFNKEKVNKAFVEQVQSNKPLTDNSFIKSLNKFMKTRAGLGFMMASAVGLSVQPINMYLTKLKTGNDGFVGVAGRSKDNSIGFFALKLASSAAFFAMILATLALSPLKFLASPSKFMDKMSFNGKMPTINQLKGIYGITIISRIFSARDKDELREVLTKDTLGYLSWLVLGDIVNRMVADKMNRTVMNYKKGTEKSGFFKRTFYAALKTRDEILIETLSKNGIQATKKKDGKFAVKSFKELIKDLDKLSPEIKKVARGRLRTLNIAQISGYMFSGLVLGLGIPNLNIYITNKLDKKRKAEAAKEAEQ